MTSREWIDSVQTWHDFVCFCNENYYEDYIENIYDEGEMDDRINDDLVHMAEYTSSWRNLLQTLNDIPEGYDYYKYDDYYDDWVGLDDYDFEDAKSDLLEKLIDDDFFDEEDEEEVCGEEDDEDISENYVPIEDEDINITELFSACSAALRVSNRIEEDNSVESLYSEIIIKERSMSS